MHHWVDYMLYIKNSKSLFSQIKGRFVIYSGEIQTIPLQLLKLLYNTQNNNNNFNGSIWNSHKQKYV